jgi:tetratricopeptide (TPR) repeat protein
MNRPWFERLQDRWLRGSAAAWLLVGASRRAEAAYTRLLERPGTADAGHLRACRAHVRARLGRHQAAIDDYQTLTSAQPGRAAADWFNLGFLLEQAGRPAEAEPAFRRALDLQPALDTAWYGLALALIRQRRHDEAMAALARHVELQPANPHGWYQMGCLHLERGDLASAQDVVHRLMRIDPATAARLQRDLPAAGAPAGT